MPTSAKPKSVAKSKDVARAVVSSRQIDAKQAVNNAIEYFEDFFPLHSKSNLLLEELEKGNDGKHWFVTLGYDARNNRPRTSWLDTGGPIREYKIFSVDSTTGKIASVKIRKV